MTTSIRQSDRTILLNGRPFFPHGFFHVTDDRGTDFDAILDDLAKIGDAKFNVMQIVVGTKLTPQNIDRIYLEAQSRGLYIMPFLGRYIDNDAYIQQYKSRPNNFAWYIWDDIHAGTDLEMLTAKNGHVKSMDPDHITSCSMLGSAVVSGLDYTGIADSVGFQRYPCRSPEPYDGGLDSVARRTELGVPVADKYGMCPYGCAQAFRWDVGLEPPTFAEYYNMFYQFLVAGAKGIINYTFFDSINYLPDYSELWAGLQTMPHEVRTFEKYVLNGERTKIQVDRSRVVWASRWAFGGKTLVIVVNTAAELASVTVLLPSTVTGPMTAPFAIRGRPASLVFSNNKLAGFIGPLEAQVYVLLGT